MSAPQATSYDALPYPGFPFQETHPDRLCTLARLFGMNPAPVERCRVLELGCGDAMNLLPMAAALPESEFTGVDLSGTAIAKGRGAADALGLRNLHLHHLDLLEFPEELDQFDYIIAHGVYSWVPAPVREKLLAVCSTRLAAHGVAYISYNCYPGAHAREMMRRILQFHVQGKPQGPELISDIRQFARFLETARAALNPQERLYQLQLERLHELSEGSIFHDQLGEVNEPCYFHEFAARAARHGMQYLAEAEFCSMQTTGFPPETVKVLSGIPDEEIVTREQYIDFVMLRGFRKTLLCRCDLPLRRTPAPDSARSFLFSAQVSQPGEASPLAEQEEFDAPSGLRVTLALPLARTMLHVLGDAWPERLPFDDLWLATQQRLAAAGPLPSAGAVAEGQAELCAMLLQFYAIELVDFHSWAPRATRKVSARPQASALARWQALGGEYLTTGTHQAVKLEDTILRELVRLCDGTRDHPAILAALREYVQGAGLPPAPSEVTMEVLQARLRDMARMALLVA